MIRLILTLLLFLTQLLVHGQENVIWKFETKGRVYSSPLVDGELLFTGSGDHTFYALNKFSGKEVWKFKTGGAVYSSPVVQGSLVYIGSADGNLYALNKANGKLMWVFKSEGEKAYDLWDYYLSSPSVEHNTVYWGSGDSHLYALDSATGKLKWKFKTGDTIHASPAVQDGKVYFGSFDGHFYSLDAESGKLLWQFRTVGDTHFPKGEIQEAALVQDGVVYFGSRDYNIYALDVKTGRGKWNMKERGSWIIATPLLYKDNLYVGTSDTHAFYCLSKTDGQMKWKLPLNMRVYGAAVAHENLIYFGCFNGKLYGVDHASGEVKWEFQTESSRINSSEVYDEKDEFRKDFVLYGKTMEEVKQSESKIHQLGSILSKPAIDGQTIYFGSSDGYLYAVKLKN
ncbi:beta-alanine-activating enzyme beta-propeller domain-containing protein [Pontibacter fetidus]|uniref:PQQ-like beta-propeller repeat protein n=1 Tax=Pontibacter fetidus TaxID=2700082 RepID=A0A6B2H600_9BACT|nr:PQQ-binding-like beta-propeller repeat protein [Pontibacter fetidus]NDK55747.1 PQQ-like beta-propeller repeat protein [Pontibacter fetidus]